MKLLLDMMLLITTFLAQFEVNTQIFSNNNCEKQIITMKMLTEIYIIVSHLLQHNQYYLK